VDIHTAIELLGHIVLAPQIIGAYFPSHCILL